MRIKGMVTHCETVPFAGQRKATSGNAGLRALVDWSRSRVPCVTWASDPSSIFRRRGLWLAISQLYVEFLPIRLEYTRLPM
jgi:hypothetical protein